MDKNEMLAAVVGLLIGIFLGTALNLHWLTAISSKLGQIIKLMEAKR